jgi:hypothetical protein
MPNVMRSAVQILSECWHVVTVRSLQNLAGLIFSQTLLPAGAQRNALTGTVFHYWKLFYADEKNRDAFVRRIATRGSNSCNSSTD